MNRIQIYTDGACKASLARAAGGPLQSGASRKELYGGEAHHQQPHGAAGGHWRRCKRSNACHVDLYLDSQYVRLG